ncbi:MAG: DMT family transporter [Pseudomonadota bacterium]
MRGAAPRLITDLSPISKAVGLFLLAIAVLSVMDAVAKYLTSTYAPMQVVWARYCGQLFWSSLVLAGSLKLVAQTKNIGLQLLRSAFLFGATLSFFSGMPHLQLAEMNAIFDVAPLIITILSVLVLREVVGIRRWLGVLIGLSGALIIVRPGTEAFSPYSIYPLMAALCFASYAITTRFLSEGEPAVISFLFTALVGAIVASLLVLPVWSTPSLQDGLIMLFFGGLGGIGHFFMILAFQRAETSLLAPFSYFGLFFNALWGFLFFAEVPAAHTILGAAVIVGAGLYVWWRERLAQGAP